MEEEDSSLIPLIAAFIALMLVSTFLRRHFRKRYRIQQGQIGADGERPGTIQERLANNSAWASGKIPSSGGLLWCAVWLLAIVWSLTFGVSFVRSLSDPTFGTAQRVVLGVFAFAALIPIGFAIRLTIQRFRYGRSWCEIEGGAGVLGQVMKGIVRSSVEVKPSEDYELSLQCLETYTTGTGKNQKTQVRIVWGTREVVPAAGKNSRVGIPFAFTLPLHPPESGSVVGGKIHWQLRIDAATEGVDYAAIFVVPVFQVEELSAFA